MKKIFVLIGLVMLSGIEASIGFSQNESKQFIHKGLFRSQGSISPGILLNQNASTISLYGNMEYYISDNISIRGDSYYFLKDKADIFSSNHSTFSGASYHFKTKNHFDPYLAFEPGISITKLKSSSGFIECFTTPCPGEVNFHDNTTVNPLISSAAGFNYYFQRWFHLFGEVRYIYGKHLSGGDFYPISLSELRFSFGLGLNLNLMKKKE